MTQMIQDTVPDLGEIKHAPVIDVVARVGAEVNVDDTLIPLETEKATMDVPSTAAGTIREVRVKKGDSVGQGTVLVLLESRNGASASASATAAPALALVPELTQAPERVTPSAPVLPTVAAPAPVAASFAAVPEKTPLTLVSPVPASPGSLPHASPSIRKFARELGVDLTRVGGTGPKGRILQIDVQQFVKGALAAPPTVAAAPADSSSTGLDLLPWPQVDFAKFGAIERAPLSKIKKISGANLSRNAIVIPHVTNFDEADITELEAFRVEVNKSLKADKPGKLTMLAFLIKASVTALKLHPLFNSSLDSDELVMKRYFHIGFAADTPNGLVVPVIRDADTKGLHAIAAEMSELAAQARAGKLKPTDMQGGCFTVSSLGGIGGTGFTPIINAPEVAILGAARGKMQPVWNGSEFVPRLILPVSVSWDHRVIDGAEAARFLVTLTGLLGDFRRVML